MTRTDRLLAIVLELQGRGRRRAEDLAATFETSKRTIYRDIQALCEAGVPLVSTPGRGYALMEGYFLPPLSFNADEATMLLLGSDVMAQCFDAQYRAAAEAAGRKIAGVLPERLRHEVRTLQESIRFVSMQRSVAGELPERLAQLRRAILERRTVRLRYFTRHATDSMTSAPTSREVDPYGLAHIAGSWYLTGHDHLRHAGRTFRLERIDELALLEQTFTRPAGFRMERDPDEHRELVIRVLFDAEVARWVRESPSYFTTAQEETPAGLHVTLRVRQEDAVLQWLLGWGRHLRVLEPESLRQRIAAEAIALARNHGNT
jgi:predicted DNA-binding transcriptional regulator YafY